MGSMENSMPDAYLRASHRLSLELHVTCLAHLRVGGDTLALHTVPLLVEPPSVAAGTEAGAHEAVFDRLHRELVDRDDDDVGALGQATALVDG